MTKVFISYARGDDEAFAKRLYADLKQAGFSVWWDRESLHSVSLTFHQQIKDAIRGEVDRLIYVAGPKAAVSDYVREEWKFALECDKPVIPILRLGDYPLIPGELLLLHCDDFRDDGRYPEQLAKLIANLRRPEPPLGKLYAVPALPAHFLGRPDLMRRIKEAVLVDLQKPVIVSGTSRVGVQGMGGIGKSVLAAALARDREVRQSYPDGVIWVTFGPKPDLAQLQRDVVRCLGGAALFENEAQGREALRGLLDSKAVMLVLDDVWNARHAQAFDVLGPRCRAVVTTRDAGILHTLDGVLHQVHLFTEAEALRLLGDSVGLPPQDLPPEAAAIVRECGCLPLAVALSGGMAKRGAPWGSILERLRRADLDKIADRNAINEQHRDIYRAMMVSVEALEPDHQKRFAELAVFATDRTVPAAAVGVLWQATGGLDALDAEDLLRNFHERSLVRLDAGGMMLHDLLHDFAVKLAGDLAALHEVMLDAYRAKCPNGWPGGPNDGYFFQNLGSHLVAAGRADELAELLLNIEWLESKNRAGLAFGLPMDFAEAAKALSDADRKRRVLELLDEAIRRDLHFIAGHAGDYPQALFQCLWNTCWWYDAPAAGVHYESGKAPGAEAGLGLCSLLEGWRRRKEQSTPGFRWVRSRRPPAMHLGTAQLFVMRGHDLSVTSVAWSPDGRRIASASFDGSVRVWDAVSGAESVLLREGTSVSCVAWSPDGRRIASGSWDGAVRVRDTESGAEPVVLQGHGGRVNCVSWSPDGRRIASGCDDTTVRVWDAGSGAELALWMLHGKEVRSVAWSPDGRRVASGSEDGTLRLWDADSGAETGVLQAGSPVNSVAWSPDGRRIAGGSSDVQIWDADSPAEPVLLRGHKSFVKSVTWSPDGQRLVSAGYEETARLWDAVAGVELAVFGHEDAVNGVAWSPDGRRIVSGSDDKTVRVWDAVGARDQVGLRGHAKRVECLSYSPDGRRVISGSQDGTARVWDAKTGAELAVLSGHECWVDGVAYSPDGRRIVCRTVTSLHVWDARSGAEVAVLCPQDDAVYCASWSPDGRRIVSGSPSGAVRVWDARGGKGPIVEARHEGGVNCVTWSPDGRRIASGSEDGTLRLWDADTGAQTTVLHVDSPVESVAWSPDGRRIAGGYRDRTLRLWDAVGIAEPAVMNAHQFGVTSVAWSPDGRFVVSGSIGEMHVWDAVSGECLSKAGGLKAHDIAAAADTARYPFAVWESGRETVFSSAGPGDLVAWFSTSFGKDVRACPDGCSWAGILGNNVYILGLEGAALPAAAKDYRTPLMRWVVAPLLVALTAGAVYLALRHPWLWLIAVPLALGTCYMIIVVVLMLSGWIKIVPCPSCGAKSMLWRDGAIQCKKCGQLDAPGPAGTEKPPAE